MILETFEGNLDAALAVAAVLSARARDFLIGRGSAPLEKPAPGAACHVRLLIGHELQRAARERVSPWVWVGPSADESSHMQR